MTRLSFDAYRLRLSRGADRKKKRAEKAADLWKDKPAMLPGEGRCDLRAELDFIWAAIIIKRAHRDQFGLCAICGKRRTLVAYHFFPRGSDPVRWHLKNGCGACAECNASEQQQRPAFRIRHALMLGLEVFGELKALARTLARFSRADLWALRDELKRKLISGEY